MDQQRPSITEGFTGITQALAWHTLQILRFRHHGEGLGQTTPCALISLSVAAGLLASTTAIAAPLDNLPLPPLAYGLGVLVAVAVCFSFFGRAAATGFALVVAMTEPVCLVARLLPFGSQIDFLLTAWFFAAKLSFVIRAGISAGRTAK